jgi:hypothetical protein
MLDGSLRPTTRTMHAKKKLLAEDLIAIQPSGDQIRMGSTSRLIVHKA